MKRLFFIILFFVLACNKETTNDYSNNETATLEVHETQTPQEVVETFISALGNRDFKTAYDQTDGEIWGTYEHFSSPKAFGSITSTHINKIITEPDKNEFAVVFVDANFVSNNKDERFEERYFLSKKGDSWKISKFQFIKKITDKQPTDIVLYSKPLISDDDLLAVVRKAESIDYHSDSIAVTGKKFYKENGVNKCLLVIGIFEKDAPHVDNGKNDIILLKQKGKKWEIIDFSKNIGSTNGFGEAGVVVNFFKFGKQNVGVCISGGYMQGGYLTGDYSLIGVVHDRIFEIATFVQISDNTGALPEKNDEYSYEVFYKFIPTSSEFYDLQLTLKDNIKNKVLETKRYKFNEENFSYDVDIDLIGEH